MLCFESISCHEFPMKLSIHSTYRIIPWCILCVIVILHTLRQSLYDKKWVMLIEDYIFLIISLILFSKNQTTSEPQIQKTLKFLELVVVSFWTVFPTPLWSLQFSSSPNSLQRREVGEHTVCWISFFHPWN